MLNLPRRARDKHRGKTPKKDRFLADGSDVRIDRQRRQRQARCGRGGGCGSGGGQLADSGGGSGGGGKRAGVDWE
jgi:hypothetical protein